MFKLLRFENRKLFRRVSLYILLGVALLMVLFVVLLPDMMSGLLNDMRDADDILNVFGLSVNCTADMFITRALSSGNAATILAILISLIITQDYTGRTVKNILSRGYTRTQVYFTKLFVCEALTVLISALCMLFAWGLSTAMYAPSALTFSELLPLLTAQLLVNVGLCAFFVCMGVLMKSGGGALAVSVLAVLFMPLLTGVIGSVIWEDSFVLTDYNLFSFQDALAKTPTAEAAEITSGGFVGMLESSFIPTVSMETINRCALVSVIWTAVLIFLGWLRASRQEL